MIENPWVEITPEKKILSIDKQIIDVHNKQYIKNEISKTEYPEPFIGNKEAKIYLLLANPGRNIEKEKENNLVFKESTGGLHNIVLNNLKHYPVKPEYPFYFLDKQFEAHSGYDWWNKAFKPLIKNDEKRKKSLANKIFSVELYGYHSQFYASRLVKTKTAALPSNQYAKYLVQNAIKENKLIVICRAVGDWLEQVEELRNYENCYFLAKNRGVVFSRTTLSPGIYKEFVKAVES